MEQLNISGQTIVYLEHIGVLSGLACVWLNTQNNIWSWVFCIISSVCYFLVFAHTGLYADMGLQVFFIASALYGIWQWKKYNSNDLKAHQFVIKNLKNIGLWILSGGLVSILLGFLLSRFTKNASLPWADSGIAVYSLMAQYLLARRYIENWIFWIGINIVCILVYSVKGLWPTALLYTVFLGLAFYGYYTWRHESRIV